MHVTVFFLGLLSLLIFSLLISILNPVKDLNGAVSAFSIVCIFVHLWVDQICSAIRYRK
jgi:hypothetical protein